MVQVEANVMLECMSSTLSNHILAKKYGLAPRAVKVMSFEVALANKLAAWCEKRLVRDIFDIYYLSNVLNKEPDLKVLAGRLLKLNYAGNVKGKKKSMTFKDLAAEMEEYVANLSMKQIGRELGPCFSAGNLVGLDNTNKQSPDVHPIPAASSGVLRTDSHVLGAFGSFGRTGDSL